MYTLMNLFLISYTFNLYLKIMKYYWKSITQGLKYNVENFGMLILIKFIEFRKSHTLLNLESFIRWFFLSCYWLIIYSVCFIHYFTFYFFCHLPLVLLYFDLGSFLPIKSIMLQNQNWPVIICSLWMSSFMSMNLLHVLTQKQLELM